MSRRLLLACALTASILFTGPRADAAAPVLRLDARGLSVAQRQLAASLQGIANRNPEAPRVFLLSGPYDEDWLSYALRLEARPVEAVTLEELLAQVKPYLKGQVLYDPARPYTLDAATTAAGVQAAALTDTDLGLTTLSDFRKQWTSAREAYTWVARTLLRQANKRQIALLPSDSSAMRDYAVQQSMVALSPESLTEDLWDDMLLRFEPGATFLGAYAAELLPALSGNSQWLVPARDTANLSFYTATAKEQHFYQHAGHVEPVAPRYLSLIFDCSDLDTALNIMPDLWQNGARGSLPLGWALPASLANRAPLAARRYYAEAYRSGTDQFVLGPSGAGFMDLARAASPDDFYRATAEAAEALDTRACLYEAPASPDGLGAAVGRISAEGGMQGVFALAPYDQPPAFYHGIPTLITRYIDTVEQGVTYLNRIPLERRFAALCLNAATMTPEDAAHLAAHVAKRYVVVPPAELMALMRAVGQGEQAGEAAVRVTSATWPEGVSSPTAPVPVRVEIEPQSELATAEVVYRPAGSRFAFSRPLAPAGSDYQTTLPPMWWGGEQEVKVRAVDRAGRVTWSPMWKLEVGRADADGDGASDAEEALIMTDPAQADTDHDGLKDGSDPRPLVANWIPAVYLPSLLPPSDVPYLTNPADSEVVGHTRAVAPGRSASYLLPMHRVPQGAEAVVYVEAEGPSIISLGSEQAALTAAFAGELTGQWESAVLPAELAGKTLYLRITCPTEAPGPLAIYSVALSSASKAPSLTQVSRSPVGPGPLQPVTVSALAFDPQGVAGAKLSYQVNGDGLVTVPMASDGPRYAATLPDLQNRDQLRYWVTAENTQGNRTASAPATVMVGGRGREIISLLARRSFLGGWRPSPEWGGAASYAPEPGVTDTAPANLTGGAYTAWVLAAGRGNGLSVSIDGKRVGAIDPTRPDGWQQVGRARLDAGRHRVTLTSEAAAGQTQWTDPRYAAVVLSTDGSFTPPPDQVFDVLNSIALLSPRLEEPLSGVVELRATGAGNLSALEFSLDGQLLRRVGGPPFTLSLSTARFANGVHMLRLEAVDRTGPTGLAVEVPLTIAN